MIDLTAAVAEILNVITDSVHPSTWRENGGDVGSITAVGDRLMITHTPATHRRIQSLLKLLEAGQ